MSTPTAEELIADAYSKVGTAYKSATRADYAMHDLAQRLATALAERAVLERQRDELDDAQYELRQRAEAAEAKLAHCGQENCMGWRLDENANWVREEVATELRAKLAEAQQRVGELETERAQTEDRLAHSMAREREAQQRETWWRELYDLDTKHHGHYMPGPGWDRALALMRLLGLDAAGGEK